MKIEINAQFCTLNEYINAERKNRYAGAKIKENETNKAYFAGLKHKKNRIENTCNVVFTWLVQNNKIDNDNISFGAKFIFDGLKKAGVIVDDSPKYINNIHHNFVLDRSLKQRAVIVEFINT